MYDTICTRIQRGQVDPQPTKRVDMTLKKQGGIRGFFIIRLSSVVEPKPEPEPEP
jgi:hypothetical protein